MSGNSVAPLSGRGRGPGGPSPYLVLLIAVAVFIVCSLVQLACGTSMFSITYGRGGLLKDILINVTFYGGWLTLAIVGVVIMRQAVAGHSGMSPQVSRSPEFDAANGLSIAVGPPNMTTATGEDRRGHTLYRSLDEVTEDVEESLDRGMPTSELVTYWRQMYQGGRVTDEQYKHALDLLNADQ